MTKRDSIVSLLLASISVAAAVVFSASLRRTPLSQRLPDGSILRIVSVSFGTNSFLNLPQDPEWKAFLAAHLPAAYAVRLGLTTDTAGIVSRSPPGEPFLAIFTTREAAGQKGRTLRLKAILLDEDGTAYDSDSEDKSVETSDARNVRQLVCWTLSRVPSNSARLVLQFSEVAEGGSSGRAVAHFTIPSPIALRSQK